MLIELVIVVAIIAVGVGVWVGFARSSGPGSLVNDPTGTLAPTDPGGVTQPTSVPGRAIRKAEEAPCRQNLGSIRQSLQMAEMETDGRHPAALPPEVASLVCPVSRKPYEYDPNTGLAHCATPGHEKL
jgi:hypothetical protein